MEKELKDKTCPFLKKKCLKDKCQLFNIKVNECSIQLLVYNLWKFSEAMNNFGKEE